MTLGTFRSPLTHASRSWGKPPGPRWLPLKRGEPELIFHQDGTLEVQNELTGIVLAQRTSAEKQSEDNSYGQLIAKNILGVNHQHFFNYRLDLDVDGKTNSVMEMNVNALPMDEKNPLGNAIAVAENPLTKETTAVRDLDMKHSREWMIVSADKKILSVVRLDIC